MVVSFCQRNVHMTSTLKKFLAVIALGVLASWPASAETKVSYAEIEKLAQQEGVQELLKNMRAVVTTQKKYLKMGNVLVKREGNTRTEMTFANFGLKARLIVRFENSAGENYISYTEFERSSKWTKFEEKAQ